MLAKLNQIRKPDQNVTWSREIMGSLLTLVLGIVLGLFAKWLDNLSINDAIRWQYIIGILDLRNVFSELAIWFLIALAISVYSGKPSSACIRVFLFFAGMCVSYHLYTILFAGFNPRSYMMIWYGLTLVSPLLAFVCWYGKGPTKVSLIIDILILAVMMSECFSIGLWYFGITRIINVIIFIGSVAILHSKPKQTAMSLLGAIALAFVFSRVRYM